MVAADGKTMTFTQKGTNAQEVAFSQRAGVREEVATPGVRGRVRAGTLAGMTKRNAPSDPPAPPVGPSPIGRTNARRGVAALLLLLLVSAAMVYGTWLAVDDLRAKPMAARVNVAAGAVTIVNTSAFTWSDTVFTVNEIFRTEARGAIEPGDTLVLPLGAFADSNGRPASSSTEPVREVAATATRKARFRSFNTDHASTGRWLVE